VRQYITTERINFATSSLAPGAMSSLDDGHPDAEEICYVVSGSVYVLFPARMDEVSLGAGDMMLIMPDEPHQLHNRGREPVQMVWCAAPGKQLMELVQRLRSQGRR
jgi:mannose-6-phosphate isomerase-like protein (cupin superfamily)